MGFANNLNEPKHVHFVTIDLILIINLFTCQKLMYIYTSNMMIIDLYIYFN